MNHAITVGDVLLVTSILIAIPALGLLALVLRAWWLNRRDLAASRKAFRDYYPD